MGAHYGQRRQPTSGSIARTRSALSWAASSYPALKLFQNGHGIYYATLPIDDLFPFSCVERFNENPEEGYQRKFMPRAGAMQAHADGTPARAP